MEDTCNFSGDLTYQMYNHSDVRAKTSFIPEFMSRHNQDGRHLFWERHYL